MILKIRVILKYLKIRNFSSGRKEGLGISENKDIKELEKI